MDLHFIFSCELTPTFADCDNSLTLDPGRERQAIYKRRTFFITLLRMMLVEYRTSSGNGAYLLGTAYKILSLKIIDI